jgi:hypothetical protein
MCRGEFRVDGQIFCSFLRGACVSLVVGFCSVFASNFELHFFSKRVNLKLDSFCGEKRSSNFEPHSFVMQKSENPRRIL